MPRDRNGEFASGLLPKYVRKFPDPDEKVIRLYAVGTSTRDISELLTDLYHTEVSSSLVSAITDRVLGDLQQWQNRPLDGVYAVLFIDALRIKIRHEGQKYRYTVRTWKNSWDQVVPFFSYAPGIRKLIYTTNAIESLNRAVRKVIKSSGSFPSVESAMKLIYLAITGITAKWTRATLQWSAALSQFACKFGERFLKPTE